MPWLTPDEIPEDDVCRPLLIPASSVWLALVSGALTELTQKYNWQQFGALTVDETVAKMQEIIDGYYDTPCLACTFPDGGKVIRIDDTGHIQQLGDDGTWEEPTGDYVIPPPEARTGGTEEDQNCLAAKNAVNVLHTLYSSLSDSFADELTEAEALTAFIGVLTVTVGFEFAPITFGVAIFFETVFQALFQALAYITADLWDDAVDNQITCFLLDCASNDGGVVTFDYECFVNALNSLANDFVLSETQLRLYLQITFILYFIGGIDGLNLAARTTEITDDSCIECAAVWCFEQDLTTDGGLFSAFSSGGNTYAQFSSGVGWIPLYDVYTIIYADPISEVYLDSVVLWSSAALHRLRLNCPGGSGDSGTDFSTGVTTDPPYVMDGSLYKYTIGIGTYSTGFCIFSDTVGGTQALVKTQTKGRGTIPVEYEDNCEF